MKKILAIGVAVILTAIFVFSAWQLGRYFIENAEAQNQFDRIIGQVRQTPPLLLGQFDTELPVWTPYDQYGELFAQNPDMIGWIAIDGTAINYPVMQTPDRPNFYLHRNFEGRRCKFGVPYIFEYASIDPQSHNITIFGHNMRNDRMFGSLRNFRCADFLREHPIIRFDTRAGFGEYEIFAVFTVQPQHFDYHLFVDAGNEAEFYRFVQRVRELSLHDTNVIVTYGDRLITLSTCEYSRPNNRLVVVARKV